MYAIGGSAAPTINSQGNRYNAPANLFAKEVELSNYFNFFIMLIAFNLTDSGFLSILSFKRWPSGLKLLRVHGKAGTGDLKEICFWMVPISPHLVLVPQPVIPVLLA
jgi:hypothetical protein